MNKPTPVTTVIFRKWKSDGNIIALLPEVPYSDDLSLCVSYMHLGQHGAASLSLINTNDTTLATPEEYKDLKAEMESIGYRLLVVKRNTAAFAENRKTELKRIVKAIEAEQRLPEK